MSDIQITTCLTEFTDEDGRTWILVFNKVLWFGSGMDHSFVNSNQICMTVTPLSDDPFDTTHQLWIHREDAFIPFKTYGTTVYFDTHLPTEAERAQCTWITMNGDTEWDPSLVRLKAVKSREEAEFCRIVEIAVKGEIPTNETDRVLGSISDLLMERTMTETIIAKVNVTEGDPMPMPTTANPFTNSTPSQVGMDHYHGKVIELASNTRHSTHTAEEVSRNFNIGIERAKTTINFTTQRGIRHDVHPLHRRYRADHMHFNRRRLNGQF